MAFYHIISCPSIILCVYNCRLFSSEYYVTIFVFYQNQKQNVCGALRDLVPFAQSKKREKHTWRSVTFSKGAD